MSTGRLQRSALGLAALSVLLLLGTALLGPSAAEPGLGPRVGLRGVLPPYELGLAPSSAVVTVLLGVGYLAGGLAVAAGLGAARRGAVLPRWALPAGAVVAVLAVLVPPLGSADHLSYAAYGRIAVGGGDPWLQSPVAWDGGRDPVTSAVEDPWRTTPSIYGPVATAVQALSSMVGGDSLRLTVWAWQLVCLAAWLVVGAVVVRHADSPARAAWLWPLNPVLLGLLVLGAHVDLLAAALGLGALLLAGRRPLVAGLLLGAAAGVKITMLLLAPALLYALWRGRSGWRPALLGVAGALAVVVPTYLAAGPHVLDQLGRARAFVSLATPWRPLVDALTGPLPSGTVRAGVQVAWPLMLVVLALLLARALRLPVRRRELDAAHVTAARRGLPARRAVLAALVRRAGVGPAAAGGGRAGRRAAAGATDGAGARLRAGPGGRAQRRRRAADAGVPPPRRAVARARAAGRLGTRRRPPRTCQGGRVSTTVTELIGVYHADGGVLGELRYAVGKLTGRAHCSLCDITHAGVRRRAEWDVLVASLPVPVRLVHLNERDPDVFTASGTATPCVLARLDDGSLRTVLSPAPLAAVAGDVAAFGAALHEAAAAQGLVLAG